MPSKFTEFKSKAQDGMSLLPVNYSHLILKQSGIYDFILLNNINLNTNLKLAVYHYVIL
jgi:hypothetical protein